MFPTTLGIEHRIVNGRVYITAIPVTDPEEIGRRAAIFGERAGYYYENWDAPVRGLESPHARADPPDRVHHASRNSPSSRTARS